MVQSCKCTLVYRSPGYELSQDRLFYPVSSIMGSAGALQACSLPSMASASPMIPHPVNIRPLLMRKHKHILCRAQASTAITFHHENTAITVPLSQTAALGLSKAIEDVLNTFREKEKAERPKRWESMEFRHTEDGVSLELFCNPNAYANPFQAKVLLTIDDEKMKIVSEAKLSTIKAEVDQHIKVAA